MRTEPPNTSIFDIAAIKEAMRKAAAIPKPEFDIIVTTDEIRQRLAEYCESLTPCPRPVQPLASMTMYGIEILAYPDEQTAKCAAIAFRCDGNRPMLVLGESK